MSEFDLLVDEAWPAPHRVRMGGWVFRHAGGVTKRANSVLPLGERADLASAVDRAERFYADLGMPCVFSMGMGATSGLDAELAARGYRLADPTLIMTAPLAGAAGDGADVTIEASPSQRWIATWWDVDGGRHPDGGELPPHEWARRILVGAPAVYASAEGKAVGRAVPQGEWLGIYCMAVVAQARRRGLARAVLRALLGWGREHGARMAYLVVTESNTAARVLYEQHGFTVAGRYHYRIAG